MILMFLLTKNCLHTSQIQFFTGFGANASEAGSEDDLSASYCMTLGDLA